MSIITWLTAKISGRTGPKCRRPQPSSTPAGSRRARDVPSSRCQSLGWTPCASPGTQSPRGTVPCGQHATLEVPVPIINGDIMVDAAAVKRPLTQHALLEPAAEYKGGLQRDRGQEGAFPQVVTVPITRVEKSDVARMLPQSLSFGHSSRLELLPLAARMLASGFDCP